METSIFPPNGEENYAKQVSRTHFKNQAAPSSSSLSCNSPCQHRSLSLVRGDRIIDEALPARWCVCQCLRATRSDLFSNARITSHM